MKEKHHARKFSFSKQGKETTHSFFNTTLSFKMMQHSVNSQRKSVNVENYAENLKNWNLELQQVGNIIF